MTDPDPDRTFTDQPGVPAEWGLDFDDDLPEVPDAILDPANGDGDDVEGDSDHVDALPWDEGLLT